MLKLYTSLMTFFSKKGVAKVKNLFALPEAEQKKRFNLLSLMVTVVFDAGVTFQELAAQPGVKAMWDTYCAQCPDASEPAERWSRHVVSR